ncbi:MAG: protein kinase [Fibromonadales bacterium]|nr:protein kinase [Fibromonadales bacterium]
MADTIAMADNSTRAMCMEEEGNRLFLTEDVIFEGRERKYKIFSQLRLGKGGESLVYKAKCLSTNEEVAAKIHDMYNANDRGNNLNRKMVIEFLNKNLDYKKTCIMPLYDSGYITINLDDTDYKLPIDIMPLCNNGTLSNKKIDYKSLKQKIIPDMLNALKLLHDEQLVHRDIKPNNLYMLNNTVVLADFGTTSKIMSGTSKGLTEAKRGTAGYIAPEVWSGFFKEAADYYSLGCTIATLYKGEHVYQSILNRDDASESELNAAMSEGLPLDCPDEEADLQELVNALVMRDGKDRAGYKDVLDWLNDTQLFHNNWLIKLKRGYETSSLNFDFNGKKYKNESELTEAMLKQWKDAKRYLYNGSIARNIGNATLSDRANTIVEGIRNEGIEPVKNEDLGLAMFLHYLNQSKCPIYWNGQTYGNLSEISKAIANKEADEKSVTAMLASSFLSWKFCNTQEASNQATIDAIKDVEYITKKYEQLGYYIAMYRFSTATDKKNITVDNIFKRITEKKNNWYKKSEEFINNDMVLAYFVNLGYKNYVLAFKDECTGMFISDNNVSDLELLYMLFESLCEDKIFVREHYLQYGPYAYLYWFQQNLNLYSFNSSKAKGIQSQIKNIKIGKNMNISEMRSGLISLRTILLNEFMKLFQNNYLLTSMGLRTNANTEGITTKFTHAFFAGDFFGINVPVGYLKTIGCEARSINE